MRERRAHAALVYDGADCVGWCQFGPPDELPRIKSTQAYEAGLDDAARLADHLLLRRQGPPRTGVADAALAGALAEIARLGGGTVESYPDEVGDREGLRVVPPQRHASRCSSARASSGCAGSASTRWLVRRTVGRLPACSASGPW